MSHAKNMYLLIFVYIYLYVYLCMYVFDYAFSDTGCIWYRIIWQL